MPTAPSVTCGGFTLPVRTALACFLDGDGNPVVVTPSTPMPSAGPGAGDIVGPVSSTANAIAVFNGTTGKVLKNSLVTIDGTTGGLAGFATGSGLTLHGGGTITGASGGLTLTATGATAQFAIKCNTDKLLFHTTSNNGGGNGYWENLFVGYRAGESFSASSTGYANIGIGPFSLQSLNGNVTQASANTMGGISSGQAITTGSYNVGWGSAVLSLATTADGQTAIGWHAGHNSKGASNTFGGWSVAAGHATLATGTSNSIWGAEGFKSFTSGTFNSGIGANCLESTTSGSNNFAGGGQSLRNNVTGSGLVGIGYCSGKYETASDAFYVNNQDRTNLAGDKAGSLLYGTFHATPASQTLTINAATTITNTLSVSGTLQVSGNFMPLGGTATFNSNLAMVKSGEALFTVTTTAGNADATIALLNSSDNTHSWALQRHDDGIFRILHSSTNYPAGTISVPLAFSTADAATFSSTISTAGGGQFSVTAVNVVSPTSPNRTLTFNYAGTPYYVAAKTTND